MFSYLRSLFAELSPAKPQVVRRRSPLGRRDEVPPVPRKPPPFGRRKGPPGVGGKKAAGER